MKPGEWVGRALDKLFRVINGVMGLPTATPTEAKRLGEQIAKDQSKG